MDAACELAGGTPWAEALSTWTSLAFLVASAAITAAALRARRGTPSDVPVPDGAAAGSVRVAFGILVALVGAGSVIQHGPSPAWSPVVHDPPLLGALALVAADAVADLTGRRLRTWWWLAPTLLGVPLAATSPAASTAAQVVAAAVAVCASALRAGRRPAVRRRTVAALVLLAAGGGVGTLTRPGWPLCDADGTVGIALQGHAVWHVLAATALWLLVPTLGHRAAP